MEEAKILEERLKMKTKRKRKVKRHIGCVKLIIERLYREEEEERED